MPLCSCVAPRKQGPSQPSGSEHRHTVIPKTIMHLPCVQTDVMIKQQLSSANLFPIKATVIHQMGHILYMNHLISAVLNPTNKTSIYFLPTSWLGIRGEQSPRAASDANPRVSSQWSLRHPAGMSGRACRLARFLSMSTTGWLRDRINVSWLLRRPVS